MVMFGGAFKIMFVCCCCFFFQRMAPEMAAVERLGGYDLKVHSIMIMLQKPG